MIPIHSTADSIHVQHFHAVNGAQIYQIPLLTFPGLWGYAYLVMVNAGNQEYRVLIDTGSGFGVSNQHLEKGFQDVSNILGKRIDFEDLTHILITHGHIDHFGGLSFVRARSSALLGVHELDLRNLTHFEERIIMVSRRLASYLIEAGVSLENCQQLIEMYRLTKGIYQSVDVDFTYECTGMRLGPFEMLHVPGHCAGHVVIRLGDILFSGDHVLHDISPHQSPEHLTFFTGLDHYLRSLEVLDQWAPEIRMTLGGHQSIIGDLSGRIKTIRQFHRERLNQILRLLQQPRTIEEVSRELFGKVHGYNILLALEETGAHIEFLAQRGLLGIANLDDLDVADSPCPIRYRSISDVIQDCSSGKYWI